MIHLSQSPRDDAFVQNPYPFYAEARRQAGAVFHWQDYGFACLLNYNDVAAVLRDRRFGREIPAERQMTPPAHQAPFWAVEEHSMLQLEPPRHTRLRNLVLRAFTSRRVASLEPEIAALSHELIDALPGKPFDLIPDFAEKLPVIVIARLLGVPEDRADYLLRWSHAMVMMYQAGHCHADELAAAAAAGAFSEFLTDYINHRRARPADDLITHLIAAEEDGEKLTTPELISTCILLLNAGHEATVHTIGNGVKALLESDAPHSVLAPAAIDTTVEEIARFDPPLHLFTRFCYEPVTVAGHLFQPGDEVGLLLAAANRDPARWQTPDTFDPTRPIQTNTSFGAGVHFCIGAPLARLELRIALPILFSRLPGLHIAEQPAFAPIYHFHGLKSLMLDA